MNRSMYALFGLATCTALAASPVTASAGYVPHFGNGPAPRLRLAVSSLGDLSPYRSIAADTLKIVDRGDLAAAKTRVKDLETAWDDAESTMKPKDRVAWSSIDKSIDAALHALRADTPRQAESAATLTALIAKLDDVGKA